MNEKKKQNKQQALFASIFALVIIIVVLYCIRKFVYIDFNGYVVVHNVSFRASEDVFVYDIYKHNGDLVVPGDTIYSYVSAGSFNEHSQFAFLFLGQLVNCNTAFFVADFVLFR